MVIPEPIKKDSRVMERNLDVRMLLEEIKKGLVRSVIRVLKNEIEIPYGLVVVDGEEKIYPIQGVSSD